MSFLVTLLIAVSLSMDAFSLALAYGTLCLDKKQILKSSFIVGLYHFFMPLLGMFIGSNLLHVLPIKPDFIVFVILSIIGLQMIIETFKEEKKLDLKGLGQLLIFGLAVSIDSFSVGIGLEAISDNFIMCSCLFSLTSFVFTCLGLFLGKTINLLIGKVSTIIGGVVLMLIGIIYLFQ